MLPGMKRGGELLSRLWVLLGYAAVPLPVAGAVKVSVVADSIQVVQGGIALLPCAFYTTAPLDRLNIIWTVIPSADPHHPQQVLAYERGEVVESVSHYAGRVGFAFPPTQSATILLNNTHSTDSGTYQCSVFNPPDSALPNIGVVQLTVFVPPSNPRCSGEGSGEEGATLQFSCTVDDGTPAPDFAWEKIPADTRPLLMSYEADDRHVLLTLHNLTTEASGLYRCTASNMLGSVSCALELRVHLAPDGTRSLVVGIALMFSMGVVLLMLLALVLWLHQYSAAQWAEPEEDDASNEIRIDSFSPGRLLVAKSRSGDLPTAGPIATPLWIFTSTTPNTTYAHREWRPPPGTPNHSTLPGAPTAAPGQGRWRSVSVSEQRGSSSGSEEEKHPGTAALPRPPGFLV
ncbi:immunoglobulin superfamily member 11-like [Hemicordylus capensis]|uniref:immunoglobulin superfamily member 11-like n=1 Tax=Hemicordylus capensis TaxID=884348 RepID=UPI002304CBF9|nr:immunoglobulin superfamily member 11-like [Hemicordylus capensis]